MTIGRYVAGFGLSLALTIVAYFLAMGYPTHPLMLIILGALALAQLAVQLTYFLHLGDEVGPRLKQLSFGFMSVLLLILVVGSIWIMVNLNERMLHFSPQQKVEYMLKEYNKGF